MKRLFILLFMGSMAFVVTAQMRKPTFRPDWTFKAPAPSNATYLYVTEHGEGKTKREALNQAIGRVFQSTANRIGQFVSTDEINRAIQAGTDYEVISRNMNVPINKVCEFAVQDTVDFTWTMYILCQVAKAGNITPEFEATEECTKHAMFDRAMGRWQRQQDSIAQNAKNAEKYVNARAFAASTFIPGMGQMLKGHGGKGTAFLLSELALFGGGTACYFMSKDQAKKMKATDITYNAFKDAKDKKRTYDIIMYTCYGVGAAVHIANMIHAWCVADRRSRVHVSLVPSVIPVNEYSMPSYAMGAGLQVNF